ncbi:MAG: ATP-binding protein [Caldilineaceae bacterium]
MRIMMIEVLIFNLIILQIFLTYVVEITLKRVFYDLVKNAVEALEDGLRVITISTEQIDNFVLASVADTGKGIPKDKLDLIFEDWFWTPKEGNANKLEEDLDCTGQDVF